jgi:hypothetical protein
MAKLEVKNAANQITITLDGDSADISAGGNGQEGALVLRDKAGKEYARLTGFQLGGQLVLTTPAGEQRAFLGAASGNFVLGGNGVDGDIALLPANSQAGRPGQSPEPTIRLDGGAGTIVLMNESRPWIRIGSGANVWLGGRGEHGDLMLFHENEQETGNYRKATVWASGHNGSIVLRSAAGHDWIRLGSGGNVWLGGNGEHGDLMLFHEDETDTHDYTKATVWLSGHNGDIVVQNADCAEDFDVAEAEHVEPGTVMVLDDAGTLRPSTRAYDRKVAGVISGAGDCRPGIVLDRKRSPRARMPLALVGKVYCKADAGPSPIQAGDLLTTSSTPGHAMKADDPSRMLGAVIGKALRPLERGEGLIPILVALQ